MKYYSGILDAFSRKINSMNNIWKITLEHCFVAIQNQRLTSETMYCSEICHSSSYTFENVMFVDIPSISSRRTKNVPTISKTAIINQVQDVISQI